MKNIIIISVASLGSAVFMFWNVLMNNAINITPQVGTNDLTDLNYQFRQILIESVEKGELPIWNKNISNGYPLMAEGQIGALYPANIIFSFLDLDSSVNATIVLNYALIFWFSALYLHAIKFSNKSALIGSTLLTYGGFAMTQLLHWGMLISLGWFMGQLFFYEKFKRTANWMWVWLMGLALGMSILGGHPQIITYSMLLLIPYWGWFVYVQADQEKQNRWKIYKNNIFALVIFLVVGAGIGAGQLLPQYELTKFSTRSDGLSTQSINRFSLMFSDLAKFVSPFVNYSEETSIDGFSNNGWPMDERYLYIGFLGLTLVIIGMFGLFRNKPFRKLRFYQPGIIMMLGLFVSLLLGLGTQTTLGQILLLPPLNFFRLPLRFTFIAGISIGILSAVGMEVLLRYLNKQKIFSSWMINVAWAVIICLVLFDLRSRARLLHPEVDRGELLSEPKSVEFIKQTLTDEQRVTSQQYFYPSIKIFLEQHELWGKTHTYANLRNLLPVFNNLLYDFPKNIGAGNSAGLKLARYNDLEQLVYFKGIDYSDPEKVTVTEPWKFINRMTGVRYFISGVPIIDNLLILVDLIEFANGQDPVYVYEFFDYYPRVFMTPTAVTAHPNEIRDHIVNADFDPKKLIYIEQPYEWEAAGGFAATSILEEYDHQYVKVNTQASGKGWLFLSDTFYPGWEAYLDGRNVEIFLGNYAFRAVPVPEGNHVVEFKYEPRSVYWGVRITVAAMSITLIMILVLMTKKVKFSSPYRLKLVRK